MGSRIYSDWSEVDEEFDRLEGQPDFRTEAEMDEALLELGVMVEAATHVITGSLAASVKVTSNSGAPGDGDWEGEIEVGGASTGVNNPVDYAIYERARGGDHDFMEPVLRLGEERLGAAMQRGLTPL